MQDDKKELIVDAMQKGLYDAKVVRNNKRISYNNLPWVDNNNFMYDRINKLNGQNDLQCFRFKRGSYELPCLYDYSTKTLMTLCSSRGLAILCKKSMLENTHYTAAFSTLSKDPRRFEQMSIYSQEEISRHYDKLEDILDDIAVEFKDKIDVENYSLLEYDINNRDGILLNIKQHFVNRYHEIVDTDDSWSQYIKYSGEIDLLESTALIENDDVDLDIEIKSNAAQGIL